MITLVPTNILRLAHIRAAVRVTLAAWLLALCAAPGSASAQASGTNESVEASGSGGPIRLRQPERGAETARSRTADALAASGAGARPSFNGVPAYRPGEFEQYVQRLVFPQIAKRFGAELLIPNTSASDGGQDFSPLVPPDYLVQPGDELLVSVWGSLDADLHLVVDRSGRVAIPRVGTVFVSGSRYADLPDLFSRRISSVFKNFQVSVSIGQLRGIRVFLTGFVNRPGSLLVSNLSTLTSAIAWGGGPSAGGSFRDIQLRRGRSIVATFDLYDLLLKGDKSKDVILQADDVIHVGPVGTQVAAVGSVNLPAIFEVKETEVVADVLRMAGGLNAIADRSRLRLERPSEPTSSQVSEIALPAGASMPLHTGDVLRALNSVDMALPVQMRSKRVRVEGEVMRPGDYLLPVESTLNDALLAAGGKTSAAHLFGTEFNRLSVRKTQQENYERVLRDLDNEISLRVATQRTSSPEEAAALSARSNLNTKLVERLKAVQPTGRVVLEVGLASESQLPDIVLEDGDRVYLPPRSATVGVFGSVFNAGSYLYGKGRSIGEYLRLAGGPTKGADTNSIIVVRANGSVVTDRQRSGWFASGSKLNDLLVEPGDTVFVPEELDKSSVVQGLKDWTTILYNLGVGAAAIKTIFN